MIRFSASAHLQTAPITASSENVPDSQSSGYRRNYYLLFEQNVLIAHIELHITESIFGIYGTTGKNLQDLRGQNHYKNVGLVYHLAIKHVFHGLNLS